MNDSRKKHIRLRTYGDYHQSYVELADRPHTLVTGVVVRTERVHNLIEGYDGPGIGIDFDVHGRAIGIEILYSHEDVDGDDEES